MNSETNWQKHVSNCPICNRVPVITKRDLFDEILEEAKVSGVFIECNNCHLQLASYTFLVCSNEYDAVAEDAVIRWNTLYYRANKTEQVDG